MMREEVNLMAFDWAENVFYDFYVHVYIKL